MSVSMQQGQPGGDTRATRTGGRSLEAEIPTTILVIEDDLYIRRVVRDVLVPLVDRVIDVASGREALAAFDESAPDLVVMDLGLPDVDGLQLCRELRRRSSAPILVLTARHAVTHKISLLDEGADDYITKPFDSAEFVARVRAQLRRSRLPVVVSPLQVVQIGALTIDFASRAARRDSRLIRLTPIEWELLRQFLAHAGRTLTHRQLFRAVWGGESDSDPQSNLRVHVANLRRKIEIDPVKPTIVVTEAGVGYRFEMSP